MVQVNMEFTLTRYKDNVEACNFLPFEDLP